MRVSLLPAFLLPIAVLAYACEDDGGGATGTFDGGTGTFEAGAPSDAAPADAAVPKEAAATGVVVNVKRLVQPAANVTVLFHDATGAVTDTKKTDAAGVASATSAPAMVTVVAEDPGRGQALLTYLGVAEGDVLNVQVPGPGPAPTPVGTFSVSFTNAVSTPPTGYEVHVNGDCIGYNAQPPIAVDLYPSCVRQNNVLLAAATDANGYPIQLTFKKGEAAPAANQTKNVQLPIWTNPQETTVTVTNPGPGASLSSELAAISDGAPFVVGASKGSLSEAGVTYAWAQGFPEATNIKVRSQLEASSQWVLRRGAPGPSAAFDLATALPRITSIDVTGATRPDVAVKVGALANADGGIVAVRWTKTENQNVVAYSWSFVVPPTVTSFKVPALSTELAGFAPPDGTATTVAGGYFESDLVPGYATFKSSPLPLAGPPPSLDDRAILPANGTAKVTMLGSLDFAID